MKTAPFLLVPLLTVAANASPSSSENGVKTRIINSWRDSFRAIHSLQLSWSYAAPRSPADYTFLWQRGTFRSDTRFTSKNRRPQDFARFWQSNEGGSFAELQQTNKGFYWAIIRGSPLMKSNPYGTPLPFLQLFHFARNAEGPYTIEAFQRDATWKHLARRVRDVSRGSYQGQHGYWLSIADSSEAKTSYRVFVGDKNPLPLCVELSRLSPERKFFSHIETTRTMSWREGGHEWLFPIQTRWRAWNKEEEKRQTFSGTDSATAIINARIEPKRFALPIPKGTFTNVLDDKLTPIASFDFDPQLSVRVQVARAQRELQERRRKIAAAPKIWDEHADGKTQITKALAEAKAQNKRVLLQFGGNLCGPCRTLHDILHKDPQLNAMLKSHFVVVDIEYVTNSDLNQSFKSPEQEFAPTLVVLDQQGKTLARASDDLDLSRASKDGVNSELDKTKIKQFLSRWTSQ